MDDRENISEVQRRERGASPVDFLAQAKGLMTRKFPFLTEGHIDRILALCDKNNGLLIQGDSLLCFYRFYFTRELFDATREQDFDVLSRHDLTAGPCLYFAAIIFPGIDNYQKLRTIHRHRFFSAPGLFMWHRYKEEKDEFVFKCFSNRWWMQNAAASSEVMRHGQHG